MKIYTYSGSDTRCRGWLSCFKGAVLDYPTLSQVAQRLLNANGVLGRVNIYSF